MKDPSHPKVGLALSGGGARGLAHIGVLKALEREGVPIDLLAGTSMGGVVAAAYAAGLSPHHLEQEALRMSSTRRLLSLVDLSLPRRGLFEGQKITDFLDSHLGNCRFDTLRIPLTLMAVDLNSGQVVELNQGRVIDAVRATIALPGLFTPVQDGERLLVDGGLLDNVPADVARRMEADIVIAVDVNASEEGISSTFEALYERSYVPTGLAETLEVLYRSLAVMVMDTSRRRLEEADPELIIRPAIPPNVGVLTGFRRAAEIIAAGEQAATEALPRIQALLSSSLL